MNGNNIIISAISGSTDVIAATKSHEIQSECETIEISSPSDGEWRKFLVGRKSWSVNVNFLVLAVSDIAKTLNVGNSYAVTIKGRGTGGYSLTGTAILTQCKQTYTRGNLCVGSFQFRGTGPLTGSSS